MYDLVIIGAGPAGIALAAEARAVGHQPDRVLILEKGAQHNWAIRQFYPAQKDDGELQGTCRTAFNSAARAIRSVDQLMRLEKFCVASPA